jgi:eukaryotic-like serine/threonine-protein kinase
MRRILRLVLLMLILVAVGMASALAAMHFAIHGREVRVPRLAGLTQTQAEGALAANELLLGVENSFYSANVAPGQVLSQYPAPNDKVRRGWRVRVAMSLGPQLNPVPTLTGESQRVAEINLRRGSFDISHSATIPYGGAAESVIAQSPQPTSQPIATAKISLLFSAVPEPEAFVMPSLIGLSSESAVAVVRASGMEVEQLDLIPPNIDALPGAVFAQAPMAGTKILHGSTVTLSIAQYAQ